MPLPATATALASTLEDIGSERFLHGFCCPEYAHTRMTGCHTMETSIPSLGQLTQTPVVPSRALNEQLEAASFAADLAASAHAPPRTELGTFSPFIDDSHSSSHRRGAPAP